jgi:hypothetical protein
MEEVLTLKEAVLWVVSGGGAGAIAYLLVGNVKVLKKLAPDYKRYVSYGITAALALLAWGAGMGMNYLQVPVDWRGWVEAAFSTIAVALFASQGLHGLVDLRQKRLAQQAE